jgi:formamidopyrimidine-DNA glycosylase
MTRGMVGIDPLSEHFTVKAFESLVQRHPQHTAKAFLADHDVLTPIPEKHIDRILASAQLAPEATVGQLSDPELHRLHRVIRDVLGHLLEGHHGYRS